MKKLPAIEKFLRFERLSSSIELMRARTVYMVGLAFMATQVINIFFMTVSYGKWTNDHSLAVVGTIGVALVILCLRLTKNFGFFAIIYSFMLFAGIATSALPDNTGINSALLPLLVCGAILNGFIGGWRHIIFYMVLSLMLIWGLYDVSLSALSLELVDNTDGKARIFQRAMQASLALFMASVCSGLIVMTMNSLFRQMDSLLEKLSKSDQEKTDFLAHMSQQLNRPVAGINVGLKKLLEFRVSGEQKQITKVTANFAKHLNQILSDTLVLSNLDKGQFKLKTAPFNLRSQIRDLITLYEPLASQRGIHLGTTYAAHLPEIYAGDATRMRQILKNLIHNAFKYTQEGSIHVYVDGRLVGASEVDLRISVKDTGVGIAPEDLDTVFSRFDQDESAPKTRQSGSGMELAICHEVMAFMGGTLHVDSQPGVGSNFEMSISLLANSEPIRETDTASKKPPAPPKRRQSDQAA